MAINKTQHRLLYNDELISNSGIVSINKFEKITSSQLVICVECYSLKVEIMKKMKTGSVIEKTSESRLFDQLKDFNHVGLIGCQVTSRGFREVCSTILVIQ